MYHCVRRDNGCMDCYHPLQQKNSGSFREQSAAACNVLTLPEQILTTQEELLMTFEALTGGSEGTDAGIIGWRQGTSPVQPQLKR